MQASDLTEKEIEILKEIATETGMSCWFSFAEGEKGNIILYDLERNEEMDLKYAVEDLNDGLNNDSKNAILTENEIIIYEKLLEKLNIKSA